MSETANMETGADRPEGAPRGLLIGAAVLLAFAFSITLFGRSADMGAVHMPAAQPYQTLLLHFADHDDGSVTITDASNGAVLSTIKPGTNGFLRSMMRGLAHERTRDGIGAQTPFKLTRWSDGTLSLTDEMTGRRVDLDAFGPNQTEVFAGLFSSRKETAP
ncbi:photosynthetic complex assembly protein PuhC [uncultured Rhodoblastus sp.]|uniref:photosynthetic complex assembly protein PuhC n=1 Tax=uncultured Rhodoblastus sp. TaxID=543037 RepID=UPI0025CEB67F|nr:photosynthetic complex assembly protein PuhC [uncultured Rhodoblastus sp.]